jgi:DNA-binding phage protein
MSEYQTWREYLIEKLSADYERAIDYLDVAIEEYQVDRDAHLFLVALRTVVESQDGIAALAKRTCTEPQALLDMLSGKEMPRIDMLSTLLAALGCRLSIEPLKDTNSSLSHADENYQVAPRESIDPKKPHNLRPLTPREWEHELQKQDLQDAILELQSNEMMQASEGIEWRRMDEKTLKQMNWDELKETWQALQNARQQAIDQSQ